ncbi:hypothetical protein AgCh_008741 [Apium graveolens]
MVREKMDQIIPSQTENKNQFKTFSEQMSRYDLSGIDKSITQLKDSFVALHKVGQSLSAQINVGKEILQRAAEGPNQDKEFNDIIATLRVSLQNNYMSCKKALGKHINFIRTVVVKVDNFLEKMIGMNINDGDVDKCLQEEFIRNKPREVLGIDCGKLGAKRSKIRSRIQNFPEGAWAPAQDAGRPLGSLGARLGIWGGLSGTRI